MTPDDAEGLIRPAYQIHAYITAGLVDSVAMIRIADLVRFVDSPPIGYRRPRPQPVKGGNLMVAVPWDDLVRYGVHLWRYDNTAEGQAG